MKNTKKKSAKERRVLIGALVVAGVITAGSTFAWFSSKDEVTNRLTATANYGVSIVEDFTPPEDMTPGQEVTKTASVVNTGNVDALVRLALENYLEITTYDTTNVTCAANGTATYYDQDLATGIADENNYAYMAYNGLITNPTITNGKIGDDALVELNRTPSATMGSNAELTPDEVTTLQAGGQLVVAASNGLPIASQLVQSGDYINNAGLTFGEYNGDGEFLPAETGLYLFRRTVSETDTGNTPATNEYSGYYYVANSTTAGDGTYYALDTKYNTTDPTNPKATVYVNAVITEEETGGGSVVKSISGLKLKTTATEDATETAAKLSYKFGYIGSTSVKDKKPADMTVSATEASPADDAITFRESNETADQKYIEVAYENGTNKEVRFYIELDSKWADNWQWLGDNTTNATNILDYFYLKDDLEAGQTSPALIKSVTMSKFTTQNNFVDLTYDINVVLDSVQVTYDADNVEQINAAVDAWSSVDNNSSVTLTDKEITAIAWAKS